MSNYGQRLTSAIVQIAARRQEERWTKEWVAVEPKARRHYVVTILR